MTTVPASPPPATGAAPPPATALAAGLSGEAVHQVTAEMSPPHLRGILSTSRMISLIEDTCLDLVQPLLADGDTTVGTHVDVSHVGSARAGEPVTISVRLLRVTGRRLLAFEVAVATTAGVISTGTHQRLVVSRARYAGG
jgi:fluoroacetyl-CoA thioesterase